MLLQRSGFTGAALHSRAKTTVKDANECLMNVCEKEREHNVTASLLILV